MSFPTPHERAHAPRLVCSLADERGAEAVEVIFALPLLIVFVVAILHFGLQMVSAEAFVSKADAAVMALDIDENAVRQLDGEALKASANSSAAFSTNSSMQVVSVSVGTEKQLRASGASTTSYIPLVYTVSFKLPSLIGQGEAKPIERAVTRRVPVKDPLKADGAGKGDVTGDGAAQGGAGDSSTSPDVAGEGAGND